LDDPWALGLLKKEYSVIENRIVPVLCSHYIWHSVHEHVGFESFFPLTNAKLRKKKQKKRKLLLLKSFSAEIAPYPTFFLQLLMQKVQTN
jgi:hypothetical protein